MSPESHPVDAELLRYWELYPVIAHVSKCRCPVHRNTWIFVDEITKEAHCHSCQHTYTVAELIVWKEAHPTPSKRPGEKVHCPLCHRTLKAPQQGLYACVCGWEGTAQEIEDAEARRLMEEAPNGAQPYRRPRRG